MKRAVAGAVGLVVAGVAGLAIAATSTVSLTSSGPQPSTVTVEWGDTVAFVNEDSAVHRVAIPRLGLQSGDLSTGSRYEVPFAVRAGTYGFRQQGGTAVNGEIVVKVSGTLTLTANRSSVPYRGAVRLSGRSTQAGSSVTIQHRPFGSAGDWEDARELQPSGSGAYATSFALTQGYTYRALAAGEQVRSQFVTVTVRPVVRISVRPRRVRAGTKMTFTGRVLPVTAASSADLEVFDRRRNSWRNVDSRAVRKGLVKLSWTVAPGRSRLRIAIRRGSVRPGFEATASPFVTVTGLPAR
jgi:plastocyanin